MYTYFVLQIYSDSSIGIDRSIKYTCLHTSCIHTQLEGSIFSIDFSYISLISIYLSKGRETPKTHTPESAIFPLTNLRTTLPPLRSNNERLHHYTYFVLQETNEERKNVKASCGKIRHVSEAHIDRQTAEEKKRKTREWLMEIRLEAWETRFGLKEDSLSERETNCFL